VAADSRPAFAKCARYGSGKITGRQRVRGLESFRISERTGDTKDRHDPARSLSRGADRSPNVARARRSEPPRRLAASSLGPEPTWRLRRRAIGDPRRLPDGHAGAITAASTSAAALGRCRRADQPVRRPSPSQARASRAVEAGPQRDCSRQWSMSPSVRAASRGVRLRNARPRSRGDCSAPRCAGFASAPASTGARSHPRSVDEIIVAGRFQPSAGQRHRQPRRLLRIVEGKPRRCSAGRWSPARGLPAAGRAIGASSGSASTRGRVSRRSTTSSDFADGTAKDPRRFREARYLPAGRRSSTRIRLRPGSARCSRPSRGATSCRHPGRGPSPAARCPPPAPLAEEPSSNLRVSTSCRGRPPRTRWYRRARRRPTDV